MSVKKIRMEFYVWTLLLVSQHKTMKVEVACSVVKQIKDLCGT